MIFLNNSWLPKIFNYVWPQKRSWLALFGCPLNSFQFIPNTLTQLTIHIIVLYHNCVLFGKSFIYFCWLFQQRSFFAWRTGRMTIHNLHNLFKRNYIYYREYKKSIHIVFVRWNNAQNVAKMERKARVTKTTGARKKTSKQFLPMQFTSSSTVLTFCLLQFFKTITSEELLLMLGICWQDSRVPRFLFITILLRRSNKANVDVMSFFFLRISLPCLRFKTSLCTDKRFALLHQSSSDTQQQCGISQCGLDHQSS